MKNRTIDAIVHRAAVLGVGYVDWSIEEIDVLRDNYSSMGARVAEILPRKTIGSIYNMAHALNLKSNSRKKTIVCVETGEIYNSLDDASLRTAICRKTIWNSIANGCLCGNGVHFRYENDKEYHAKLGRKNLGRVVCVETGVVYNSASSARKDTGILSIHNCLKGKNKTAGGYHWKYVEEE